MLNRFGPSWVNKLWIAKSQSWVALVVCPDRAWSRCLVTLCGYPQVYRVTTGCDDPSSTRPEPLSLGEGIDCSITITFQLLNDFTLTWRVQSAFNTRLIVCWTVVSWNANKINIFFIRHILQNKLQLNKGCYPHRRIHYKVDQTMYCRKMPTCRRFRENIHLSGAIEHTVCLKWRFHPESQKTEEEGEIEIEILMLKACTCRE